MIDIPFYEKYNGEKKIALLDNSTVAFMHQLTFKGFEPDFILEDYDIILIPKWVIEEIKDSDYRSQYVQSLITKGFPIYIIPEESYAELVAGEEINLYHIVKAAVSRVADLMKYLRMNVAKEDLLDLEPYEEWISDLYVNWPVTGVTEKGHVKKKNAGEISLTVLSEIFSWYYPETELLTVYTQDADSYDFLKNAEAELKKIFSKRNPFTVTYKSNDVLLWQMYREGKVDLQEVMELRKDFRTVTFTKKYTDQSVALITKQLDNNAFANLIQSGEIQIIF